MNNNCLHPKDLILTATSYMICFCLPLKKGSGTSIVSSSTSSANTVITSTTPTPADLNCLINIEFLCFAMFCRDLSKISTCFAVLFFFFIICPQLIQRDARYQWMLLHPSANLNITTSPGSLPTAARLAAAAPVSMKCTYYLFTRLSTDVPRPLVTLLLTSSAVVGQTDLLYLYLQVTNL